jgi:zeaxanthin glucosyltransferase
MSSELRKWHFGVLPFTGTGHVTPLIALSQELKDRGHRLTFFEKPKIADRVRDAGLEFCPIRINKLSCEKARPERNHPGFWSEIATLDFNLRRIIHDIESYLHAMSPVLMRSGVEALIINEIALAGPTLAQLLRLPYFLISTSLPHNFGWKAFPWHSGYKYSTSWCSLTQSILLENSALRMHGPIRWVLDRCRRQVGLGPLREMPRTFPALAQITQLPQCLDLPRNALPANFHYAGPFIEKTPRPFVEFPWNRLDNRPMIYASLGTTRNVQPNVLRMIAMACQCLEVQLVVSLGNRFEPELFADLPGGPIVVKYAPQLELLKLATIVVTHAGSNTVLEALMEGKPMIAIPVAYDQPAISLRLARCGVAEVLPIMRLTPARIRTAVTRILNDCSYREAALTIQNDIRSINGSARAADVIEEALARYADAHHPDARNESDSDQIYSGINRTAPSSVLN